MVDFKNIEAQEVKDGAKAEFVMDGLDLGLPDSPVLILAPAGALNKMYHREALRNNRQFDALIGGRKLSPKMLDDMRAADVVLYAKHVVKGWNHIVDSEMKKVSFNVSNVTDFLRALPMRHFEQVRSFCLDAENFVDAPDLVAMAANFKKGSSGN